MGSALTKGNSNPVELENMLHRSSLAVREARKNVLVTLAIPGAAQ